MVISSFPPNLADPDISSGKLGEVVPIPTLPVNLPSLNEPVPLALILPSTVNFSSGVDVPIPTLSLLPNIYKVLASLFVFTTKSTSSLFVLNDVFVGTYTIILESPIFCFSVSPPTNPKYVFKSPL